MRPKAIPRGAIFKDLAVKIFRRDGWICHWCGAPVIFAPAMKYLERLARAAGITEPLAYYNPNWRRDLAPLLDHLGAENDHIKPHSQGGSAEADNFVTSCHKCNLRKSASHAEHFSKKSPRRKIKAKYGEPVHWDGLSTLFMILVERDPKTTNGSDLAWFSALKATAKPN